MDDAIIEVEDLVKVFKGEVRALDGLSLTIQPGSIYGLLGPNGAGKTTIIRVLTTLLLPDEGTARVAGLDVRTEPAGVRARIGLAGQSAAVDEVLTGRENVEMVGRLYGLSRREVQLRATEVLERIRLMEAADRQVKTYSGGMRRRLDLAASLVGRPQVLCLDEPTAGLDPASRRDLWALIGDLVDTGTTVLLTTQYLEEADRLADRIAVIDHGRLVSEGTGDQLKDQVGGAVLELTVPERDRARTLQALAGVGRQDRTDDRHPHGTAGQRAWVRTPRGIGHLARLPAGAGLAIGATDFFTVETMRLMTLYVLLQAPNASAFAERGPKSLSAGLKGTEASSMSSGRLCPFYSPEHVCGDSREPRRRARRAGKHPG